MLWYDHPKNGGKTMTKYQPQLREEIVKNLQMIAEDKQLGLSDHVQASLWNAIEILEEEVAQARRDWDGERVTEER